MRNSCTHCSTATVTEKCTQATTLGDMMEESMHLTSSPFVIFAAIEKLEVFSRDSCVFAIPPPFTHWSQAAFFSMHFVQCCVCSFACFELPTRTLPCTGRAKFEQQFPLQETFESNREAETGRTGTRGTGVLEQIGRTVKRM